MISKVEIDASSIKNLKASKLKFSFLSEQTLRIQGQFNCAIPEE